MPSNTPLPAAEFRRIDDKLYYYAMAVLNKGDRGAWGDDECALFGFCREYSAARAASPRTLEEALMIDEALAFGRVTGDDDGTSEWAIECRMARQRHARRLAGEGGRDASH